MDFANFLPVKALPSTLDVFINQVLSEGIGIIDEGGEIRIIDFTTGRPCIDYHGSSSSSGPKNVADRFKIKIPFAGKHIIWEVVFNSLSLEDPPDFNLNDENFTRTIDANILEKFIPSLNNWKYDDPNSLKNVITEFISFYKKYQLEQLKEDNYCWFEYLSILKTDLVNESDVEVLVSNNGYVYFLIRLCPDLSDFKLPQSRNCYAAHIMAYFSTNPCKMAKPSMKFTPLLENCLISKQIVTDYSENTTLAEFIVKLNEKLEDSMSPVYLTPIAKRKRFIFEWLSCFGRKVIEYDAIKFESVAFLFDNEGFLYILSIHLPKDFTSTPPSYKLQSVYLQTPFIMQMSSVPYFPHWPFKTMMTKAISFIESQICIFRKKCIDLI